jgi:hypothetical protein
MRRELCSVGEKLKRNGFDIFHLFDTSWLRTEDAEILPRFSRDRCVGVIIGNTKLLWDFVMLWWQKFPEISNPIDTYCLQVLNEVMETEMQSLRYEVRWSHLKYGNTYIPMQRICNDSRLAYFDPNTSLCIHHTYGPWFALRAVISVDLCPSEVGLSESETPPLLPSPLSDEEQRVAKVFFEKALSTPKNWEAWVQVRDSVSFERTNIYRYGDEQMQYHYTKQIPDRMKTFTKTQTK